MGREERLRDKGNILRASEPTYDALGRPLQEGDEVLLVVRRPFLFKLEKITAPSPLDSSVPPNTLRLDFRLTTSFLASRGLKNPEFYLVRTVEEINAMTPGGGAEIPTDPGSVDRDPTLAPKRDGE